MRQQNGGGWGVEGMGGVEGCGRMGVIYYIFMHSGFEVLDLLFHYHQLEPFSSILLHISHMLHNV